MNVSRRVLIRSVMVTGILNMNMAAMIIFIDESSYYYRYAFL